MPVQESKYATDPKLPSTEEMKLIKQIRSSCEAEIEALTYKEELSVVGDLRICRFLRARHGNVKEATEWFRNFLTWRKSSGMEEKAQQVIGRSEASILRWYKARRNPYLPICPYAGRTADGHVLWFIHQGQLDAQKFVDHRPVPKEADSETLILILEWTMWYLDTLSRREEQMVYCIKIGDFSGFGADGKKVPLFVSEFKEFISNLMGTMQKHYCEHDSAFVLVNTPMAFRLIFSMIKMILTKRQASKMKVLGDTSQADITAQLREYVSDRNLPALYGGPAKQLPGFFPFATEADIKTWYEGRPKVQDSRPGESELLDSAADLDVSVTVATVSQDIGLVKETVKTLPGPIGHPFEPANVEPSTQEASEAPRLPISQGAPTEAVVEDTTVSTSPQSPFLCWGSSPKSGC